MKTDVFPQNVHVTIDMVEDFIVSELYIELGERTTVCLLKLKNGMEVVGTANRQNTSKHNKEIGEKTARSHAINNAYGIIISFYNAVELFSK